MTEVQELRQDMKRFVAEMLRAFEHEEQAERRDPRYVQGYLAAVYVMQGLSYEEWEEANDFLCLFLKNQSERWWNCQQ